MSTTDTAAVCGVCLRDLLMPLVRQAQKSRGQRENGQFDMPSLHGRESTGAINMLAKDSGVHQRRIYGVLRAEFATVGLRTADALCVGFDRPDLMQHLDVFDRPIGRRVGEPGQHVCRSHDESCESCGASLDGYGPDCLACQRRLKFHTFAAACRVAAVEPSPTKSAPASGSDSQTRRAA